MPDPALTDAQLIARALVAQDQHAFAELVKRHQSSVRACLRKLTAGNHALADDLAQETFVAAYRNLASFRHEAKFSTWLYRIATNASLADARRRREVLLGDRDAEVAANDDGDGDDTADAQASPGGDHAPRSVLRIDMERALAALSDGERAAIVQCYHNDLSHDEAAYVLGCPVGTVKTHVLRGKAKLKRLLSAWGEEDRR